MSEKDPYETDKLPSMEGLEVAGDDSKIETAIMQPPEGIRQELRRAWSEYKKNVDVPVIKRVFNGDESANLIYEKFFKEVLAGGQPSYNDLRTEFIQNTQDEHFGGDNVDGDRVTQPIVGKDLTREGHPAVIIEPGENRKI